MDKRDYLSVCNEHHVAINDFQAQFCNRCVQKECTRSQFGKDKFDIRVNTWKERLFDSVPTMTEDDVRYLPIHNARFFEIQPSLGNVSLGGSSWDDPLPPADNAPKAVQKMEPVPTQQVTILEKEDKVADPATPPMEAPKGQVPTTIPRELLLTNAPSQQGKMLNPPPSQAQKAIKKDPWADNPPPSPPDAPIVQPGAKVKLGSD